MEYDIGKRGYDMLQEKKHYDSLDGFRVLAAVGIVIMHVNTNLGFPVGNQLFQNGISFLTSLVRFFLMISAFGLCCGYFEKIQNNSLPMDKFYEKRIAKIWPFFALVVLLDMAAGHDLPSLIEGFADLTLLFGLLPNAKMNVIGVGWFIGIIFVFYIFFPFFCVLLKTKKRAWFVFFIAIIYNIVCCTYFFNTDHVVEDFYHNTNFLYAFMYFVAGGLLYLYREELASVIKGKRIYILLGVITIMTVYLIVKPLCSEAIMCIGFLVYYSLCLCYGICSNSRLLNNKYMKFLSGISMEIFLSHMIIFRVVVKLHLSTLFGKSALSFVLDCIMVFGGAIVFSLVGKKFIEWVENRVKLLSIGKESK